MSISISVCLSQMESSATFQIWRPISLRNVLQIFRKMHIKKHVRTHMFKHILGVCEYVYCYAILTQACNSYMYMYVYMHHALSTVYDLSNKTQIMEIKCFYWRASLLHTNVLGFQTARPDGWVVTRLAHEWKGRRSIPGNVRLFLIIMIGRGFSLAPFCRPLPGSHIKL